MDVVFEPQMWLRALAGGSMIGLAASDGTGHVVHDGFGQMP